MVAKEDFKRLCRNILLYLARAKYEKRHVTMSGLYREFSDYDPKDVDFALWYLEEKGFVKGLEITAEGYDAVGA